MSQQASEAVRQTVVPVEIPPLESGDRLTRHEFERRYQARPEIKKAELIEGVVYMPSPVRASFHTGAETEWIGDGQCPPYFLKNSARGQLTE